ncbi:MAG: hypothetical protein E7317_11815 [Clostridiales bacterium]|nr:hypothetical protein [Clostridiales bacterium]
MKTYRPLSAGFIVIYALTAVTVADSCYTAYCQMTGKGIRSFGSFSLFIYLIAVLALFYCWMYARTKTVIGPDELHIVFPAYVNPSGDGRRAPFIYRQGELDLHMVDKTFPTADVVRWGFAEDLGVSRLDKSRADEKAPLLAVHEIAFMMKDGRRYHMNAAYYTKRQQAKLIPALKGAIPVPPEGKLASM